MFCTILSDGPAIPGILSTFRLGHWLQYLLGGFELVGGVAILFPELCAFGTLVLLPAWAILLTSKTLAAGNSTLETAMVVTVTIVALGNLTQLLAIFRTKSLGKDFLGKRVWWRATLYFTIPACLIFALVGTLFYLVQKAESGKYDIRGGDALYQGKYAEAISNYEEAIRIAQKFPKSTGRTVHSLNNLGAAYLRSNQLAQAEATFREAIQMSQAEIDSSDPLYYRSVNGLATTFTRQLRYPEAEALYLQAIASYASLPPPPPPEGTVVEALKVLQRITTMFYDPESVAAVEKTIKHAISVELSNRLSGLPSALDGLASIYQDQRQFEKAEDYFKRALLLKGRILGGQFPNLGQQLLDTRLMTDDHGKPLEGLDLYNKFRPFLGHMSMENRAAISESLNNIGITYWEQGRHQETEPLYLLVLAINRSTHRERTPDYAMTLTNLGLLYNSQGRYAEAEPKLLEALAIRDKALDLNHPDLAHSYNNLALLYDNQSQAAKAAPLYEKALALRQKSLGQVHPKTVLTLNLLANLYLREAQLLKAEPLFIQLLQVWQQELGAAHPTVLTLMRKLAGIYSEQGKNQDALALYEQMIPLIEEQFGPNSGTILQALSSYADVLRQAGKLKEFEQVRKRIQQLSPEILPPPIRPYQKPKHKVESSGKLT